MRYPISRAGKANGSFRAIWTAGLTVCSWAVSRPFDCLWALARVPLACISGGLSAWRRNVEGTLAYLDYASWLLDWLIQSEAYRLRRPCSSTNDWFFELGDRALFV